jgi:hypothetical protein
MRKIYFFGAGIVLLCLVGWAIYNVTRSHRNVSGDQAVASLSATGLYNEFAKNETEASKKWVGKVIEITGVISSINPGGNYIAINLRGSDDAGVNCSVLKKDLPPGVNFRKGDSVSIKGKCTGFLMDVNMVDCIVNR